MSTTILPFELAKDSWSEDLDSFNYGLFHTPQWIEAMSSPAAPSFYLNFEDENAGLVGKLAGLKLSDSRITGTMLYCFSGLLIKGDDQVFWKKCMEALLHYAKKHGFSRIMLYSFDYIIPKPMSVKGYYYEGMDEFRISYEGIEGPVKVSSNLKRNAKKATKAGVTVQSSTSPEILNRMMQLLNETRATRVEKHGVDYDPMYIRNMNEKSLARLLENGLAKLFYSELNGEINTVLFALEDSRRIYFLLMGSDEVAYQNGIPALVALTISDYALDSGKSYYNLGVIPRAEQGGEGVRLFKEQQGALSYPGYCYYSWFLSFPYSLLNPLQKWRLRRKASINTDA